MTLRTFGTAIVHPLVLLGISDQVTRMVAKSTGAADIKPQVAAGVLLGRQLESQHELLLTFEMKISDNAGSGAPEIDFEHLQISLMQTKLIFPNHDVLGWYVVSSNTRVNDGIARLHQSFLGSFPSALLMVFDSTLSGTEASGGSALALPMVIYETASPMRVERSKLGFGSQMVEEDSDPEYYIEVTGDGSIPLEADMALASRLLPLHASVESGEAERIAVEHVANVSRQTSGMGELGSSAGAEDQESSGNSEHSAVVEATKMAAFLSGQRNALEMLHKDILILRAYVGDVISGSARFDPEILQLVQRVLSNRSVVHSDEQFELAMNQEETNYKMALYMVAVTNAVAAVRDVSQRSNVALQGARSKHAAFVPQTQNMMDGGLSDMMSVFGGGRHGRQRRGFDKFR
ncbi:COP9 signalosome complex subunit 6 [Coemansia sp. Benny D115]|nr:COP9 signalosome complex subunit 6 [Coemansia sp. Benny D115]